MTKLFDEYLFSTKKKNYRKRREQPKSIINLFLKWIYSIETGENGKPQIEMSIKVLSYPTKDYHGISTTLSYLICAQ